MRAQTLVHSTCTCRSRDKGVLSNAYAEVLATKEGPLCRQFWRNETKSWPIDRPRVATSSPSAKRRTDLGPDSAIIF